VVDDNTLTQNDVTLETAPPALPIEKVPPPESRFLFVDIAALRAKQLRRGARVRLPGFGVGEPAVDAPRKPERIAMEEVKSGLVAYDIPHPRPPQAHADGEE
jgi:DNA-directed RNA polymerase subunit K/omega